MKLHSAKTGASSFLCFKPLVTDTKTDKVFSYPSPHRRSGSEMDECFPERGSKIDSRDEKFRKKRGFIRSVKAVLLHIKLRGRNREMRIKSESLKSSSSRCSFRLCRRSHDYKPKIELTKSASMHSSTSSSMLSSSSDSRTSVSSSINPISCPHKEQDSLKKQGSLKNERSGSIVIGVLLIVISLAITVFWGRLWAIAFNAMWMAFIPESRILRSSRRRPGSEDAVKIESIREHRRRVIMEGLLDRKHLHHHQAQQ